MKIKNFYLLIFFLSLSFTIFAQAKIYNPKANAKADLSQAIKKAKAENKHVFIQVGGNWCPWCILMHDFYTENQKIDSILNANYVPVLINYSRENKNLEVLEQLDYPQRFGFPVIVILDKNGNRLHTQNTAYLEEGKGYNEKVFADFLKSWNKNALDPKNYQK